MPYIGGHRTASGAADGEGFGAVRCRRLGGILEREVPRLG